MAATDLFGERHMTRCLKALPSMRFLQRNPRNFAGEMRVVALFCKASPISIKQVNTASVYLLCIVLAFL